MSEFHEEEYVGYIYWLLGTRMGVICNPLALRVKIFDIVCLVSGADLSI